jgi:general transcription factor 3C polypeptide 5 (transcription factor C subunit 1)
VPLFLPPQIFSRVDTVHKHLFKKDSVYDSENPATLSMIGVNRQRRLNHARYVEFSLSANVPTTAKALTYDILKIKLVKREHFDLVKKLFQQRPIWTRLALLHECKLKNVVLKHILPAIAFYYTTGPWRVCWVRLGYDPRVKFEARYYQTLDYRVRTGALKHDVS